MDILDVAAILAKEIVIVFLLVTTGIIAHKTGLLNQDSARSISNLILLIVIPIMMVDALQSERNVALWPTFLVCTVLSVLFHIMAILIARRVFPHSGQGTKAWVSQLAAVFSNCGFMGFPLIAASVGRESLVYGAVFMGVFNVVAWVWAAPTLSGEKPVLKLLLRNPSILSFGVGIVLYFSNIRFPVVIRSFMGSVAGINTPLSMMVIGVFLASIKLREVVTDRHVYLTILLRNILFPLITLGVLWAMQLALWLPDGRNLALTFMISVSCSSAANTILLSARYGADSSHGAKLVAGSTLFSILSLPAIIAISYQLL